MFGELIENLVRAIAGMNGDIGIDEVGHGFDGLSISSANRHFNRPPLFNMARLGHAPESSNDVTHTVARRKNRDDVAQTINFQIEFDIRIGKLRWDANRLAVTGFERASSGHGAP